MTQELLRKSIHVFSLSIPILYLWNTRSTMIWIFLPLTILLLILEFVRYYNPKFQTLIKKYFGGMMREHEFENGKLTGATFVIVSALLCVLLFPKVIMIPAFAVLIISDTCAALFGRRFGKHKFFNKSLEGSLAFVISAWIVSIVTGYILNSPTEFYYAALVACVAAACAEAVSWGVNIDDNFTIPISYGSVLWGILSLIKDSHVTSFL